MAILHLVFVTFVVLDAAAAEDLMPSDARLRYKGRHKVNETVVRFDWVGSGVSLLLSGAGPGTVAVDMDGDGNRFAVYCQGLQVNDFFAGRGRQHYDLLSGVAGGACEGEMSLMKASESNFHSKDFGVSLFGVFLHGFTATAPALPKRRIDVYGDSDTAAYGVDGTASNLIGCGLHPGKFANFAHGWVSDIAVSLDAEVHVQAVSGIGVLNGAMSNGNTLPDLLDRSLQTENVDDYNASSWVPSVVVLYVGSNDYVGTSYPEANFTQAYEAMVSRIIAPFEVAPPVVHICGMEATPCNYIKAIAERSSAAYTTTGPNSGGIPAGCLDHRSQTQQATLAERVAPVIAAAAGWGDGVRPSTMSV